MLQEGIQPVKKKRGRPKGSKNKPKDNLLNHISRESDYVSNKVSFTLITSLLNPTYPLNYTDLLPGLVRLMPVLQVLLIKVNVLGIVPMNIGQKISFNVLCI